MGRLQLGADVVFVEVGGEGVLLSTASETYYALNAVGARIWRLSSEDMTLEAVEAQLQVEFDVSPGTLSRDIAQFTQELRDLGLCQII